MPRKEVIRTLRQPARLVSVSLLAGALLVIPAWLAPHNAFAEADALTPTQMNQLARHFGFGPLEIFKLEHDITQLRIADFNNDGANDVVVANNAKSTIDVLLQHSAKPAEPEQPEGVNDLVDDWRFERKKVSVTWRVASLEAADVTGDSNADLVFSGEPKDLVVLPGKGDGTFGDPITRRVRDALVLPSGVEVADLNADGRLDILLLGESDLLIFHQPEAGGIGKPTRLPHAISRPFGVGTPDLDGDGLADVVLVSDDEVYPLQVRYQTAKRGLGPAERLRLPALRSLEFAKCLGQDRDDLLGIERVSGRLKRWGIQTEPKMKPETDWAVRCYPLPGTSDVERLPVAIGDLTGNGLTDVATANVEGAQLVLFQQALTTGLQLARTFGGQIKMADMCVFDSDADGTAELFILSSEEESIACSTFRDNRLTFPKAIPTAGRPCALAVSKPTSDGKPLLAYVSRNKDSDYELVLQPIAANAAEGDAAVHVKLEGMDDAPNGLRWADANQDGLHDLLIFSSFDPLVAAIQQADGTFTVLGKASGAQASLVNEATTIGFAYADTDGDGAPNLLLARKGLVRALRLNSDNAWEIVDQYNAPTPDAQITGICTVPLADNARPALAMYDRKGGDLHFLVPGEGGTYTHDRSLPIGTMDLKAMQAAPLNGADSASILLADKSRLVLVLPDTPALHMTERGIYESSIKNARLRQVAAGDVNHDGCTDLAVTEAHDQFVEILTFGPDEALVRATKFRVFAGKQSDVGDHEKTEPHWIAIADVTSDKIDDILLIVHDRILLYPGE